MSAISKNEFLRPPERITSWRFPDQVTRESFASVLIRSFLISIGDGERQVVYLDWLKTHTGFEWRRSIRNFRQTDGWDRFTQEEQERFMKGFEQVKSHETGEGGQFWEEMHENPKETLDDQLEALFEGKTYTTREFTKFYKPLIEIKTESELIRGMNGYFYSPSLKNDGAISARLKQKSSQ